MLISHAHQDHLDFRSLRRIGRHTRIVAPRGCGSILRRHGFRRVDEVEVGQTVRIGTLEVRAIPADHPTKRMPFGGESLSVGYAIDGEQRIVFLGDTDLFEEMAHLGSGLDVALVPVWGWGPTLGAGHLDPERAARAMQMLRPRIAIPIHWGTFAPWNFAPGDPLTCPGPDPSSRGKSHAWRRMWRSVCWHPAKRQRWAHTLMQAGARLIDAAPSEREGTPMSAGNAPASRARRWLVPGLLILATFLGFLSIIARWADQQALDTNQWVDTSTKLLENEEVRNTLAAYLVDELYTNVDVAAELRARLPPELQALSGPAAAGLRDVSYTVARRALESPRVQTLWEEANRRAHQRFIQIVKDEGTENVATTGGDVTIDLRGLLLQVAQQVGLSGKRIESIPPESAQLVVMSSDELSAIQTAADLLDKGALAITILTLLLFAVAVYLARGRRREALRGVAIGFIIAGLLALVVRAIAGDIVVDELAKTASIEPAAQDIWNIGTALLARPRGRPSSTAS